MDKIDEVLVRGVDKIYPDKNALEKLLRSGKKIRIFQGFDPTGIQLHIGHLVGLMKLRQFQKLGHEVIFLIGDGTGQAGDPSGKTSGRNNFCSSLNCQKMPKDYVLQAEKVIDFKGKNKAKILYNSDWLNKLNLVDLLTIAGHFTLQQMEERDLFEERKKKGLDINMREFLYPLLQGYDSVAINADLEIGGSDQTFNMLAGRKLVREIQAREKFVLTTPLLTDTAGKKIGKTEGNTIALTAKPNDLFGMVMNLPDDVIIRCLTLITDLALDEIRQIQKKLQAGDNPINYKKRLAFELVQFLNSRIQAQKAQVFFEETFQKKSFTSKLPEIKISQLNQVNIIDFLIKLGLIKSRSEAKRLVNQKAVDIDGKTVENTGFMILPRDKMIIRVGKHKIIKLKI